jgi:hypothetical protein
MPALAWRNRRGYVMAIVLVVADAHGATAITEDARDAITRCAVTFSHEDAGQTHGRLPMGAVSRRSW